MARLLASASGIVAWHLAPPPSGPRAAARRMRISAVPPAAAAPPAEALPVSAEGEGPESLFFVPGWPDDERLWDQQDFEAATAACT